METTLVIMAAGMGKRFGALKQMEPVDDRGNGLLQYSVYDARCAGFDRVVFVIRHSFAEQFQAGIGKAVNALLPVSYVYQETDSCLPDGFTVPQEREKPWGTGHAVLSAKDAVNTPFAVINADDYYGRSSFEMLHRHLTEEKTHCMVSFRLENTLSDHGTVARGVCETEDGRLLRITEHTELDKNSPFSPDTPVSMNMWGFFPSFFQNLSEGFASFLQNLSMPEKEEFYLPSVVDSAIRRGENIRVLQSRERWHGITYRDDLVFLQKALAEKTAQGLYQGL